MCLDINLYLDITLAVAVEDPHAIEGSVFISFWGFFLKDAELRPLVAGGWGSYVFGNFDFGSRSYRGTFLLTQNKAKTKEIEAITLSFSPRYHPSQVKKCKAFQALRAV